MTRRRFMNNNTDTKSTRLGKLPNLVIGLISKKLSPKNRMSLYRADPKTRRALLNNIHKNKRLEMLNEKLNKVPFMGKNYRKIVQHMRNISPNHAITRSRNSEVNRYKKLLNSLVLIPENQNNGGGYYTTSNRRIYYNLNNHGILRTVPRNPMSTSRMVVRNIIATPNGKLKFYNINK